MIIAICEMKEKDTYAQVLFWSKLNEVMANCGHPHVDFKGFMANEVDANWRAICTVFNGGPENVMQDRERSCLFHGNRVCKYTHPSMCKRAFRMSINASTGCGGCIN